MTCENDHCIYNRKTKCILDEIYINSLGMCDDCIIVSLNDDFLINEKEKQLRKHFS